MSNTMMILGVACAFAAAIAFTNPSLAGSRDLGGAAITIR